ncbi:hypothetical protein BD311DRAFT_782659 [Dichomitus squalens]|uniref:CCHC-type domain-containing protein n=1 Tax=Dichomitus squalens TaxID=114155 RepID=A0A4V2JYP3_9APHY|nr:hypothetical protein BD311DRAFT_782659 [Dichomitus squalens]
MDMPVEGTKLAPKLFKGEASEVEPFLRRYERLATLHNLTAKERCETVTDYCNRHVRETIEGFKAYHESNWDQLKADIRKYWNADLESKRFRVKDLEVFVAYSQRHNITELRQWRKYLRNFIRVAGWLHSQGKLSDYDYAYHMWIGLHPRFRTRLETRILLEQPNHDMSEPFSPESITKAAEVILSIQRFDTERLGSDEAYTYDSENEKELRKDDGEKKRARKPKHSPVFDDSDTEEEDSDSYSKVFWSPSRELSKEETASSKKEQKGLSSDDEFDKLVDQMQSLSLEDPKYGILFLKACKLRPMAADCLRRPMINVGIVPQNMDRDAPPHMNQPNPNRFLPRRGPPAPPGNGCFGCGEIGHIMNDCPKIQEMLNKRVVLRDYRGRLTHPDGTVLRRGHDENWMQAISPRGEAKPATCGITSTKFGTEA